MDGMGQNCDIFRRIWCSYNILATLRPPGTKVVKLLKGPTYKTPRSTQRGCSGIRRSPIRCAKPYKWPCKWVSAVVTHINGVMGPLLIAHLEGIIQKVTYKRVNRGPIWARVEKNSWALGDGKPPTFNDENSYNWYINPYYWVDDHPLLYGNVGSLDPGTFGVGFSGFGVSRVIWWTASEKKNGESFDQWLFLVPLKGGR